MHQEIAACVAHQALNLALAGTLEPVLEQVVGLEFGEGLGALPTAVPQDPGHRQPGVVIQDGLGHSAQEGEGGDMAIQEGLGGVGFDETAVAVGQVQDEAVGFLLHSADDHQGLDQVALGMPRRVGQRHEHLPCLAAMLPHVVLEMVYPPSKPYSSLSLSKMRLAVGPLLWKAKHFNMGVSAKLVKDTKDREISGPGCR